MDVATKILVAPGTYLQGPGAAGQAGERIRKLGGHKALVIGGKRGLAATRQSRQKGFAESGIEQIEELFGGESSQSELERLTKICRDNECDTVIGSGGGKSLDISKCVAAEAGAKITVTMPTTASNDSPTSALGLIYSDDHVFERFYIPPRNPDIVVADTEIIVNAPVRTLIAGMGDALATWLEADACYRNHKGNFPGGGITRTALACARLCYDTLMEYGEEAKIANENHTVTPAFEAVVEANVLLSGLGWESGGLAAAHALQDGFSVIPEIHDVLHGEKVGFLVLAQVLLDDRPYQVKKEVFEFARKIGLPMTLKDLHCENVSREMLMQAVHVSCLPEESIHNLGFPISEERVFDAIIEADAIGRKMKQDAT
ncbi:MAG: glycerol dehydrogenase [Bilifractor sp.]